MQKEMGIGRETLLNQNALIRSAVPVPSAQPMIVTDSNSDPMYPIDANPPKHVLMDLLGSDPMYPVDPSSPKGFESFVSAGSSAGVIKEIQDAFSDNAPLYPLDIAPAKSALAGVSDVNPSPTNPTALTVSATPAPIDPVQRITSLLDLFESRFAQPVIDTQAVPSQQGGYIFVPTGTTSSAGNPNLLIWLAVLGIAVTIGFFLYERYK